MVMVMMVIFVVLGSGCGENLPQASSVVAAPPQNPPSQSSVLLMTLRFEAVPGTSNVNIHVPQAAVNSTYFMSQPPTAPGTQVCANSGPTGWGTASQSCVAYSAVVTDIVIPNVPTLSGRFTGNISLRYGAEVIYAKLNNGQQALWQTDPPGGVTLDGSGGYQFDILISLVAPPTPPANYPPTATMPATPSGVTATAGDRQIVVSWNMNNDGLTVGYEIFLATAPVTVTLNAATFNAGNAASYTFTGLVNNVTYYVVIEAYDWFGRYSTPSTQVSAMPKPVSNPQDITPPPAPTGLSVSDGGGVVNLTWNAVNASDLYGYWVYWRTSQTSSYGNGQNVGNRSSIQLTGFPTGITFYFVVEAYDYNWNFSGPSNEVAVPIAVSGTPTMTIWFETIAGTSNVNVHVPQAAINSTYFWSQPPTAAGSQVCANSNLTGWGTGSTTCVYYSLPATDLIVTNVPTLSGRYTGNISLRYGATVVYAKLNNGIENLWATNPTGGIQPDGAGGYHIDLQTYASSTTSSVVSTPTGFTVTTAAGWVYLSWNPNPEPDLFGYLIKFDTTPGSYLNQKAVDSKVTSYRFMLGTGTATYYFILEAFNTAQIYSQPAGPVSVTP